MNYNDLREVCTSKKISIKELTEQIGYTRQGLQSALDNQTIELRKLKSLCEVLKISIYEFFKDENQTVGNQLNDNENTLTSGLKREIELLKQQITDKEEIISLLKDKINNKKYLYAAE